jgi:amidohydrolase
MSRQLTETDLLKHARALGDRLIAIRRTLHAHPEFGFQEHQTAALIAREMTALGARVRTGVGKTGVVAELGHGSPVIAVRVDMDALPIQEATGLPFASKVPGMMHACGHDAHVTCGLGAAMLLAERLGGGGGGGGVGGAGGGARGGGDRIEGTVRLLFQPSEEQKDDEGWSGAMRMLDDGALGGVDAAISLHTRALPVGSIGVTSGPALAANDTIIITVQGKAAHGARPHEGIDALAIAAQVIVAINHIVSRRIPAIEPGVISLTTINGGIKENIVADLVTIGGTVRSTGGAAREAMFREIERALEVGRVLGATCALHVKEGYPLMRNDPGVTDAVRAAAAEAIGAAQVVDLPYSTWAEDFAYIAQRVPASMFWLGVTTPGSPDAIWHSPTFTIDEDALPIGATVFAASVLHLLRIRSRRF